MATAEMVKSAVCTLEELERFLTWEAALLDDWKLDDWLALFRDGSRYLIPCSDAREADPDEALFLIADDYKTLQSRVRQLTGKAAWAESPRARTRRLITNVQLLSSTQDEARVAAHFAVWHFQHGESAVYVGRYEHILLRNGTGLLFRERKAVLDMEALRPHGKIAFIL
jgi:p-cumate 2,3-dioxygenase subunit beta